MTEKKRKNMLNASAYRLTVSQYFNAMQFVYDNPSDYFVSQNRKTDSFIDYCDKYDIDVDDVVQGAIIYGEYYQYCKNDACDRAIEQHARCLILKYHDEKVSDEGIYAKFSIDTERHILHVAIHRDCSDLA